MLRLLTRSTFGLVVALILHGAFSHVHAADHRVEVLDEAPPTDGISEEIQKQISKKGFKIVRGKSRTICEIWPCNEWDVKADFKPSEELLYPFKQGQLIGILRFGRSGKDFRQQKIGKGVYTLRYALQPTDGNHEGTSPTRDFLVLLNAEDDKTAKPWKVTDLLKASAKAAESSHPAMMCLQRAAKDKPKKTPAMRHNEEHDWWLLQFSGKTKAQDKSSELLVELIVAGHALE